MSKYGASFTSTLEYQGGIKDLWDVYIKESLDKK